ncbi:ectoine synthase [Streptomyces venezuelae]|uniref:L-ectoine synthase n=1 Tax=Streptomyces venezuelae TaxID=54571 RepID=A0A5B9T524_STRVZ|nr:ectoine synthase [Streptomyces sp. SID339]QEG98955.1 Ant24 [Streptomyces venezuelae]
MLVRSVEDVVGSEYDVDWGNGTSRRLLVQADELGFSLTETYVQPGSESYLRYDNHQEVCYCVSGAGSVETADGLFDIKPGMLYAPGMGEPHILRSEHGMTLMCVFSPALQGPEKHLLTPGVHSSY